MDAPVAIFVALVLALTAISFSALGVLIWRDARAAQRKPQSLAPRGVREIGLPQRA